MKHWTLVGALLTAFGLMSGCGSSNSDDPIANNSLPLSSATSTQTVTAVYSGSTVTLTGSGNTVTATLSGTTFTTTLPAIPTTVTSTATTTLNSISTVTSTSTETATSTATSTATLTETTTATSTSTTTETSTLTSTTSASATANSPSVVVNGHFYEATNTVTTAPVFSDTTVTETTDPVPNYAGGYLRIYLPAASPDNYQLTINTALTANNGVPRLVVANGGGYYILLDNQSTASGVQGLLRSVTLRATGNQAPFYSRINIDQGNPDGSFSTLPDYSAFLYYTTITPPPIFP